MVQYRLLHCTVEDDADACPPPLATALAESDRSSGAGQLEVARAVLRTEAAGLQALAACLDDSFARAVDMLAAVTGRSW